MQVELWRRRVLGREKVWSEGGVRVMRWQTEAMGSRVDGDEERQRRTVGVGADTCG